MILPGKPSRPGTSAGSTSLEVEPLGARTQSAPAGLFNEDGDGISTRGGGGSGGGGGDSKKDGEDDDDNVGGPFLLAPPKRGTPMKSAKEWHRQNKEVLRTLPASGGAVEYVPTAEDEAEANAAKERELTRKRQDLRNDHPFLSMTKKDRQDEMEDRYDAALSKVFEPERIRLEEAEKREAEAERKRVEEEARMLA